MVGGVIVYNANRTLLTSTSLLEDNLLRYKVTTSKTDDVLRHKTTAKDNLESIGVFKGRIAFKVHQVYLHRSIETDFKVPNFVQDKQRVKVKKYEGKRRTQDFVPETPDRRAATLTALAEVTGCLEAFHTFGDARTPSSCNGTHSAIRGVRLKNTPAIGAEAPKHNPRFSNRLNAVKGKETIHTIMRYIHQPAALLSTRRLLNTSGDHLQQKSCPDPERPRDIKYDWVELPKPSVPPRTLDVHGNLHRVHPYTNHW
ncbi:hypothetical protein C8J57DRAFT_1243874 [Mycena rebaudengoi]|nr:hypothetical protein C8J57DRAFT_1243874 [Mycena rebaudengoi]